MLNFKSAFMGMALGGLFVSTSWAVELVPYQAGYTVSLNSVRDTRTVSAVTGQIAYGVEKICDGWLFQQNGTMSMHLANGNTIPQVVQFSSIEKPYNYQFSANTDGASTSTILGRAEMPRNGGQGQVTFSRPESKTFSLPTDTLFPVAHTRFMVEQAQAGKKQFQSHIFEGAEVDAAKLLVVFVSPMSDAGKAILETLGADLKSRQGWNFRMAYFDPKNQTGEPVYEVGVDQLDNGIALRWVLDYGTHAVEMKMVKADILDKPNCSP